MAGMIWWIACELSSLRLRTPERRLTFRFSSLAERASTTRHFVGNEGGNEIAGRNAATVQVDPKQQANDRRQVRETGAERDRAARLAREVSTCFPTYSTSTDSTACRFTTGGDR